jgi:hypothetical protein
VREPHVYTLAEAEAFAADLRNAAQRDRLPTKGFSLRVVADPPLKRAKEQGIDKIRVQFYVIRRPSSVVSQDS